MITLPNTLLNNTIADADEVMANFNIFPDPINTGWIPVSDTWAYASDDSPTFTITVPSGAASLYGVGMRIKLTQTTVKYFIITAVADTVLTVYGGTDYTLANAAISDISYSLMKAPLGFPLNPEKWTILTTNSSAGNSQSNPVAGTWYNIGSFNIIIPIGAWMVSYETDLYSERSVAGNCSGFMTLSTGSTTESDIEFTVRNYATSDTAIMDHFHREKTLVLVAKTTYYLNTKTDQAGIISLTEFNDNSQLRIAAICAYL